MSYLDDVDAGGVETSGDLANVVARELVGNRVGAIAHGGIADKNVAPIQRRYVSVRVDDRRFSGFAVSTHIRFLIPLALTSGAARRNAQQQQWRRQ